MQTTKHSVQVFSTVKKSDCGAFRFVLTRKWNKNKTIGAFLCANPSKADELRYDNTVFKCQNIAVNWGWGGFHILNLYPHYSTNPNEVIHNREADLLNSTIVNEYLHQAPIIILACGNRHHKKLSEVIKGISTEKLFCLQRNKGGGFQHPARIDPNNYPTPVRL